MISNQLREVFGFTRNNIKCCGGLWMSIQKRQYFEGKFKEDSSNLILKLLNDINGPDDLSKYSISKANSTKLIKYKNLNGGFTSVDDLVPFLGQKPLERLYNSILKGDATLRDQSKSAAALPNLSSSTSEAVSPVNKVMSICINGNILCWSLISKHQACQGSDNKLELDSLFLQKMKFSPKTGSLVMFEMIKEVVKTIPSSDVYVFEDAPTAVPTAYLFKFAIHLAQVRAFTMGLLASRDQSQIVSIKAVAIARMFKLHVGSEKVSGQSIIEKTMTNETGFKVSEQIRWNYLNAAPEDREHLSNALLLNIGYWKTKRSPQVTDKEFR